jgi:CRP-like cAMP-binding protein
MYSRGWWSRGRAFAKSMRVAPISADTVGETKARALGDLTRTSELTRPRRFMLPPNGTVRRLMNTLLTVLIYYTLIATPLTACFLGPTAPPGWDTVNVICDLVFFTDILLTFRTSVPNRLLGIVITSPRRVASTYVKSWFALDLIASLPIDYIIQGGARRLQGASGFQLVRVLKALRFVRMYKENARTLEQHLASADAFALNPSVKTLGKLLLSLCLYWHWIACVYYYLSLESSSLSVSSRWAGGDWNPPGPLLGREGSSESLWLHYLYALYWAIGLTCQINLPQPDTPGGLVFSVFVSGSGVLTLSMIIGAATTVVADLSAQATEVQSRLQRIARYMRYKQLPQQLCTRVLSFYAFQQESAQLDENSVLLGLPRSLKLQMQIVVHMPIFLHLPLFRMCSDEEILMIVQCLKPSLALPGEALVRQGERGVGLFFLMKGVVEILQDGNRVLLMSAISAFGETALLEDVLPNATVRGMSFCEVNVLTRVDFQAISIHVPALLHYLQMYIWKRDTETRRVKEATEARDSQRDSRASRKSLPSTNVERDAESTPSSKRPWHFKTRPRKISYAEDQMVQDEEVEDADSS